jgi:parvulin-like peptidyl-prolyl isomerase
MKKMTLAVAILALAIVASCGGGTKSGKVLAEINGDKITEGDVQFLGDVNPRIKAQIATKAGRDRIIDNMVEQELLYQEAVKQGINRDPKVKEKVDLYRRVIIAQSLVDEEIAKSAKKYYDEHSDEFKKLKLSDIMVKYDKPEDIAKAKKAKSPVKMHTEAEALKMINELKARIDKGEEFEKVAKDSSEDVATKTKGGDMGLVSQDDKRLTNRGMGPVLEKAFTMTVGQMSGPIKTDKGYYLVKVTRGIEVEPFAEVEEQVAFKVRGDSRNELLAKLKKDATIEYPDREKPKDKAAAKKDEEGKPGEPANQAAAAPEAQPEGAPPPATGAASTTLDTNAPQAKSPQPVKIDLKDIVKKTSEKKPAANANAKKN